MRQTCVACCSGLSLKVLCPQPSSRPSVFTPLDFATWRCLMEMRTEALASTTLPGAGRVPLPSAGQ